MDFATENTEQTIENSLIRQFLITSRDKYSHPLCSLWQSYLFSALLQQIQISHNAPLFFNGVLKCGLKIFVFIV